MHFGSRETRITDSSSESSRVKRSQGERITNILDDILKFGKRWGKLIGRCSMYL